MGTFFSNDGKIFELFLQPKNHSSIVLNYNTPSDWNSFSNENSYSSNTSQERIAENLTVLLQPTPLEQQWSNCASQLTAYDRMSVFESNQRSLHSAIEYPISLLNEFCPFKLESNSFFHRTWDNLLDLAQGTHRTNEDPNIARMVESRITFCKLSFDQPELQNILLTLQTDLKPLLFDNQGNIKLYVTSAESRKYEAIKNTYRQAIAKWEYYHGIEQCAKDALNSNYPYSAHGIPNPTSYIKSNETLAQPFAQLQNKPAFKDLCDLNTLCNSGNFDAAYAIVQKYQSNLEGLNNIGGKNYYKELYLHKFYQKHNYQGIRKEYLCDPFCQTLSHLPARETASEYNIFLANRAAQKNEILQKCQLHNPSDLTRSIIYEIIDLHENPQAVIDHVCAKLSSDHSDPQHRASYHDLFDNSSKLKFIDARSHAMPALMGTTQCSAERALYNKLLISDYPDSAKIDQALRGLGAVCSLTVTDKYRTVTHTLSNAIISHNDNLVALIPDFTANIGAGQEICNNATVDFFADHLPSCKTDDTAGKRLVTISQAHKKMLAEDHLGQEVLERSLTTGTINYTLIDAQATKDYFGSQNLQPNTAHAESLATLLNGHKEFEQNEGQIFDFDRLCSAAERIYCIAYGIAYEKYEHFRGNSIEFALFKLDLQNLKKGAELYTRQMNPTLRKVYEFGVQSNFLTHSFIKSRDYLNAMDLTTLVYKTFKYVDNTLNSMGHGIVEACAGIGEGFKDMPARVQELISNACNIEKRFAILHQQCTQTTVPIITFTDIHNAIKNPALIIQGVRNCYTAVKDKLYATASSIYQTGIRGCSKIITQTGIEIYVLHKAEKILHAGQQALTDEAMRLQLASTGQTPSHAERFIIDAEITQLESSITSHKPCQLIPEFATAVQVESKVISFEVSKVPALAVNAIQKAALNQKTPAVPSLGISKPPVGSETLTPANEALIRNFNPAQYNQEVIDVSKLSQAVEMFALTKGAMGQNGPLKQVLINGTMGTDTKISLKGPMYELEKAIDLTHKGEKIIEFGKTIESREFDLMTKTTLIECKNIEWKKFQLTGDQELDKKINKSICDAKSTFCTQKSIACRAGFSFEIHSKNKIPAEWENWFTEKNISFLEG